MSDMKFIVNLWIAGVALFLCSCNNRSAQSADVSSFPLVFWTEEKGSDGDYYQEVICEIPNPMSERFVSQIAGMTRLDLGGPYACGFFAEIVVWNEGSSKGEMFSFSNHEDLIVRHVVSADKKDSGNLRFVWNLEDGLPEYFKSESMSLEAKSFMRTVGGK